MKNSILIIDDQIKVCRGLARDFEDLGYNSFYASSGQDGMTILTANKIQVVLLDLDLGREDGIDVLKAVLEAFPGLAVIMITGFATVGTAVEAMKLGALDFIEKPLDFDRLIALVVKACHLTGIEQENAGLRQRISQLSPKLVTQDPVLTTACEQARQLAGTDLPVLILGESGTGKELMAEFIHNNSTRSANGLQQVNCAAFPDNLLDDELFGHEKGAFTGADKEFPGVFERADGSTLHLDEIGDMALATQARILRVLQNREVKRLGGTKTMTIDVRFIASTNGNLQELIGEGCFREDLFFRLNAAVIRIPPLRERMQDIPLLAHSFLDQISRDRGESLKRLTPDTLNILMNHLWPGNVRELKNCIQYAAAISGANQEISPNCLPHNLASLATQTQAAPAQSLADSEKTVIEKTLAETGNNKKLTAQILGISRNTLYNKLQKYGL